MNPIRISTIEYRPQDANEKSASKDNCFAREAMGAQHTKEANSKCQHISPVSGMVNSAMPSSLSYASGISVSTIPTLSKMHRCDAKSSAVFKSKRIFKVIIIGDAGVGKTCLSYRFCNGRFPEATEATIGVDFRERSLIIDDELIRVQLWDTAGQERYRGMISHYYRNVNAVVFVYDVFDAKSFKSLPLWIEECRKHALTSCADTPHILVGNKCDLNPQPETEQERIKTDKAQVFADENDMALFETSALADSEADHVESIFLTLVYKLRQSKPMHVQSTEERSRKEQQKILLKADEAAKLAEQEGSGMCC